MVQRHFCFRAIGSSSIDESISADILFIADWGNVSGSITSLNSFGRGAWFLNGIVCEVEYGITLPRRPPSCICCDVGPNCRLSSISIISGVPICPSWSVCLEMFLEVRGDRLFARRSSALTAIIREFPHLSPLTMDPRGLNRVARRIARLTRCFSEWFSLVRLVRLLN